MSVDEIDWDELEDEPDPGDPDTTEAAGQEPPQLVFGSAAEFMRDKLAPTYRRDLSNRRWCNQWWLHAEAVSRVTALWRAWEHLRLDPATGMSVWWRDHADPHMAVLLSSEGPFSNCTERRGHHDADSEIKPLPLIEPPAEMFPDTRDL
ncbi:DUF4913 domain-containing protein [Rhodococcus jostii]|uniref:DUF4913 domain-containing protein n=1 Tax=Rhodococcus jostii TaxID=132919 RepID=UPI0036625C8D